MLLYLSCCVFFFKQKTAYEMRISDWSSDVCSSDLSMEHPVFSLSTKPDNRMRRYEHNGNVIEIIPSGKGLATIHDKDISIYCISQLVAKMNQGQQPSRTVRLQAYDML